MGRPFPTSPGLGKSVRYSALFLVQSDNMAASPPIAFHDSESTYNHWTFNNSCVINCVTETRSPPCRLEFRGNFAPLGRPTMPHGGTMRGLRFGLPRFAIISIFVFGLLRGLPAKGDEGRAPFLVTQAVNNDVRVTLRGSTHPLARAEFDRGTAPLRHGPCLWRCR